MKRLTLMRHAKTEREAPGGGDFDRRLTERGRTDAEKIGRAIRELGLSFDQCLCSTARRAAQSAEIAGLAVTPEARIYEASMTQLMDLVRGVDDHVSSLIMVGHNPGFAMLLGALAGVEASMPTGSLAGIDLPIDRWSEAREGEGRLIRFLKPKELD